MWSLPENFRRLSLPAVAMSLLLVAACGFHPIYGEHSALANSPLQGNLVIDPIAGVDKRPSQILRNALDERFNPELSHSAAPDYRLHIKLVKMLVPTVVKSDGTIQRYDVQFNTTFQLYKTGKPAPVFSGVLQRTGSYNVATNQNFATYEAEQDATVRVLGEMTEDYVLRLSGYFATLK